MKKFTKILPYVLVIVLGIGFFYGMTHAQGIQGGFGDTAAGIGYGVAGAGTATGGGIMGVIRVFINWVLGLLGLISLVILLYGGFNMVTAAGEEAKYKKGFKILQQAAVGLAIIGLSWIIVSAIFRVITGAAGTGSGGTIQ